MRTWLELQLAPPCSDLPTRDIAARAGKHGYPSFSNVSTACSRATCYGSIHSVDENDVLRDEGEAHGRKLAAAGVPVRSVRYDGTIHDFMLLDPIANTFPGALDQGQGCPGARTLTVTVTTQVHEETTMSLDNASHAGRTGPDELVPSRYAHRVGEIDVLVVSDGVLSLPGAMLGHNADPAVRAAWLEDNFLPDVFEWALNVVVVRSGGRTVLIDAGLGADPDLNLPRAGRLVQRLEAAGIDLASVTDVVLTHLHMDHIGGLLVDGVRDRLRPDTWRPPRPSSGRRPISPASPCRRGSRTRFGGRPSGS